MNSLNKECLRAPVGSCWDREGLQDIEAASLSSLGLHGCGSLEWLTHTLCLPVSLLVSKTQPMPSSSMFPWLHTSQARFLGRQILRLACRKFIRERSWDGYQEGHKRKVEGHRRKQTG